MANRKLKNKRPETTDCLAGRLYALRLEHNLTAAAVARQSCITSASYCRYESGLQKGMVAGTLFKLAKTFNCNPVWLWTGKGTQEPHHG